MNETVTFGDWLRQRRKSLDITQEVLADRVGCSYETIRKIEAGTRRPSREMVEALAQRLAVPPEERSALVEFARIGTDSPHVDLPTVYRKEPASLEPSTNLPKPLTTFVGRHKEVEAVRSLLLREDVRLLTLTGPGGTGKTRLGLQAAAELLEDLDEFPDGVWFVELAALTDHNLVVSTIAQTLGVKEEGGGQPLIETLKAYLKDKRLLLVVDNFEQVIEAAAQVGLSEAGVLGAATGVKMLVTSRVPLRVRGEHEYSVPPLSVPDPMHLPALMRLTQYEAVHLFIERAQAVKADFEVDNDNAPSVAKICVRLDGLPLAIELAAARMKMLPPHSLLTRLSQRLKVLTGGARDLSARQQTLRATIDWSYDLLEEGEEQLFSRMAVFQGGRTLEALEAVCNYDGMLQLDIFDGVQSLVDKSLLQHREGSDGEPRFWMLETIHEYAREKLEESGEAEPLQREHARYFMRLAEEAEPHLVGAKQAEWLEKLEVENDNSRAALRWGRNSNQTEGIEVGLRLAGAIWRFWYVRGYYSEGREQLSGLLASYQAAQVVKTEEAAGKAEAGGTGIAEKATETQQAAMTDVARIGAERPDSDWSKRYRAKALNGAGVLAWQQGDYDTARSLHEESLALGHELGDKRGIANSLLNLGNVAHDQGDYRAARSLYEESLALQRQLGDKWSIANSLNNLGAVADSHGDYATARSLYEESLALRREIGDKGGSAAALGNLGNMALEQGDYPAARSLFEESLALDRELGDKRGIASLLNELGNVADSHGDYASARQLYEESLTLQQENGDKKGIATSLCNLGKVAYEQGDNATARSLHEESLALRREIGDKKGIAVSLAGLGGVAVSIGWSKRGTRLLAAVQALLGELGTVLDRGDRLPYERAAASAREQLSEEAFGRAWQEGLAMSMEQAIEYALERTGQ